MRDRGKTRGERGNSFHPLKSGAGKGREGEKRKEEERRKQRKLNYYVRTLQLNLVVVSASAAASNNAKVARTFTDKDLGQKYGRLQTNRAVAFSTRCRNFHGLSTFPAALPSPPSRAFPPRSAAPLSFSSLQAILFASSLRLPRNSSCSIPVRF